MIGMEIPNSFLIVGLLIGLALAILGFWLGWIAWWAIPIITVVSPVVLLVVFALLLQLAWMAGGSH